MATNAVVALPTLSSKGWITDIAQKCDMLMAHFYASDYNQSQLYPTGQVANIQGLIQQHGPDIMGFKTGLRSTLENYLGRYFDSASIDVSDDGNTNLGTKAAINIYGEITQAGETYVLANQIFMANNKFLKAVNLTTNGTYS